MALLILKVLSTALTIGLSCLSLIVAIKLKSVIAMIDPSCAKCLLPQIRWLIISLVGAELVFFICIGTESVAGITIAALAIATIFMMLRTHRTLYQHSLGEEI